MHIYLVRVSGVLALGATFTMYRHLESRDPSVSTSVLLSRACGGLICLVTMIMDYNKYQAKFTPAFLSFSVLGTLLVTLGCFVYTFKGSSFGRGNLDFSGRLSHHLLIHTVITFMWAFNNFGYPDANFSQGVKVDPIHLFQCRLLGVMSLQGALEMLMSLGYQNEKDQRDLVLGGILSMALMFGVMVKFVYDMGHDMRDEKIDPTCRDILVMCILLLQFLHLLYAYFNWQWPAKLKFKRK